MSEDNSDNYQSQNDGGDLEEEIRDSELNSSHVNISDGGNDLEENNSLEENELHEDQEIEDPIEEIEDDYNSQNSSSANELSTSDDLSNDHNEDHFELNSTNYKSDESSYFATNDQSVNEITNKEDEIREQLDLNLDKPLLDGFFEFDKAHHALNQSSRSGFGDLSTNKTSNNLEEILDIVPEKNGPTQVDEEGLFWIGKISKGGGNGTGYVNLPLTLSQNSTFSHGDRVKLNISSELDDREILVDTIYRVSKNRQGFYVHKDSVENHDLIGKRFNFSASKVEGFKTIISQYKQVIIPGDKLNEFQISEKDIINLRVKTSGGQVVQEPVIIKYSDRTDRRGEHIAIFRINDVAAGPADAKIQGKLETLGPEPLRSSENMIYTPNLFPGGHIGKLEDDIGILFKGNHSPIEVPLKIDFGAIYHYMGCYFADGTKKGHAWKMSASTPEQAMYYNKIYDNLLPAEDFKFNVTYSKIPSDTRTDDEISRDIKKYWEEKTYNSFNIDKVYIVDARVEAALNRNNYGSLEIRNDKGLVMQFHQKMLDQTMEIINNSNNSKLLWNFVHGVFEGDGYVAGGTNRFGLGIACNLENYKFIQSIFDKLEIKYSTDMSRVNNGVSNAVGINFYKQEVLRHFAEIEPDIFKYYPKRADRFFMRLDGFDQPPRRQRR